AGVAINHEGHDVAKRLNDLGYSAYVLFYRLPKVETMEDKRFGPLQDPQYAMAQIRAENPNKKVVVIGFSAGRHLAATLSNLYDRPQTEFLEQTNLKPDFSVLWSPVICMAANITLQGSKTTLIGPDFAAEDVVVSSMEKPVDKDNQAAFLMSGRDDKVVPIENSSRSQDSLGLCSIRFPVFTY